MHPTPVVKWLLIINFVIFCLQNIFEWMGNDLFQTLFQLATPAIHQGYFWQFFTYMFLHGGVWHLLFNLITLYFFGIEVEATLGSKRLLQMYLLGGLVGGLFWYIFNNNQPAAMVGASGAIYAIVIAFATLYPNRPITLLIFFVFPVTLLAKYLAIGVVAASILISISGESRNIAHLAHLGGAAVGYLFVKILAGDSRWFPRLRWPWPRKHSPPSSFRPRMIPFSNQKDEFIQQRIDPILDKIAEQGIQSLTPEERRLLDQAKDRLP